ncbi:MAG: PASTA domain-containing protein [Acidimicrobiales bacterium]
MTGAAIGGASGGATGNTENYEHQPMDLSDGPQLSVDGAGLGLPDLADVRVVARDDAGVTYQAVDLKLQRPVEVRVFSTPLGETERTQFDSDSKRLGRLSAHPNVVTVYDAGFRGDGHPYLVSELVEGVTLDRLLAENGPMSWQMSVDITMQICAGLEQAHSAGALHRDLRPATIVMAGTTPKLSNFNMSPERVAQTAGTPRGLVADAFLYSAPETLGTASNLPVWDERSDLYSLASTLHEMIDGHAPFWRPGDDSAEAVQLRLTHEKPPALEPELVPPALAIFITAALSKDPFDRPQTANEFAHELRLIREGRTTGSTPSVLHGTTGSMPIIAPPPDADDGEHLSPLDATHALPLPAAAQSLSFSTEPIAAPSFETISSGAAPPPPAPISAAAPQQPQPGLQPPEAWAPPVEVPLGSQLAEDQTAIHAQMPELIDVDEEHVEKAPRSNAFMAAIALMALGVVGLAGVVAVSALSSDGPDQAAPVLPDPNAAAVVVAGETDDGATESGSLSGAGAMSDGEAMDDAASPTTVAPADEMDTTETTVPIVLVPRLIGLSIQEASKQLTDAGFEIVVIGRKSANAAPGTVTQQKPDAGAMVTLPLTVTLYIPKVSNLPNMAGRRADVVCLELEALTLTCNRVPQYSDTVPSGTVIATNPMGGALFSEGSSVDVTVSRGPVTTVSIPSVTGLTKDEAEASLTAAGFTLIGFQEAPSENVDLGLAIGSNPAATTAHRTDQLVVVSISTGPAGKTRVPNVVDLDQAAAEAQLLALGFEVTVENLDLEAGDPKIGKVTSINPGADSELITGSAVVLTIGRQAPIESTTTTAQNTSSTESSTSTTAMTNGDTTTSSVTTTTQG